MLGRLSITSVYAQMDTQVHTSKTRGDNNAMPLILEFANGAMGVAEEWTKLDGMDDRREVTVPREWLMPICSTAAPYVT